MKAIKIDDRKSHPITVRFPSEEEGIQLQAAVSCGTCGKQIEGTVFWNRLGPAHRMCQPLAE